MINEALSSNEITNSTQMDQQLCVELSSRSMKWVNWTKPMVTFKIIRLVFVLYKKNLRKGKAIIDPPHCR